MALDAGHCYGVYAQSGGPLLSWLFMKHAEGHVASEATSPLTVELTQLLAFGLGESPPQPFSAPAWPLV